MNIRMQNWQRIGRNNLGGANSSTSPTTSAASTEPSTATTTTTSSSIGTATTTTTTLGSVEEAIRKKISKPFDKPGHGVKIDINHLSGI